MEILEIIKGGEIGYFGLICFVTIMLLNIVVELINELVINYHKK